MSNEKGINYEEEVKKIYPDAKIVHNYEIEDDDKQEYVVDPGGSEDYLGKWQDVGEALAWENAYNDLKASGVVKNYTIPEDIMLLGRSFIEKDADASFIDYCAGAIEERNRDKWISIDDKKPLCYKGGNYWDGLQSDELIALDKNGEHYIAIAYCGSLDGNEFFNFYDKSDFELNDITHWQPLP